MGVPEAIRKVPRPKNTYVIATGKNKDRYSVIEQIGCKRVGNRNLPISGRTIGHIINFTYVPKNEEEMEGSSKKGSKQNEMTESDSKEWATVKLCDMLLKDMLLPVCKYWGQKKGVTLYVTSILKVCFPGTADSSLQRHYIDSFLKYDYPQATMSASSIGELWKELGNSRKKIVEFMKERVEAVAPDHTILIDSSLRSNDSIVNCLSAHSRKSRLRNRDDIVDMLSFDFEEGEPVAMLPYQGNMPDNVIIEDYLRSVQHDKGTEMSDKGIPVTSATTYFEEHPNLHFIYPLKRNLSLIKKYEMMDMDSFVEGIPSLLAKKVKLAKADCFIPGRQLYMYSFRDDYLYSKERTDWKLHNSNKVGNNGKSPIERLKEKDPLFGTITFLSDHDWTVKKVYLVYENRWEIEIANRYLHQALGINTVRVHETKSIVGSEMSNYLALILLCRLVKKFTAEGYLGKKNFSDLMEILHRGYKSEKQKDKWVLNHMNPSELQFLKDMGLDVEVPVKKQPGRKMTNPDKILLEQKRSEERAKAAEKLETDKKEEEPKPFISRRFPLAPLYEIIYKGVVDLDEEYENPNREDCNRLVIATIGDENENQKNEISEGPSGNSSSNTPKRRGRKPKAESDTTSQPVTTEPKRRGRKPKAESDTTSQTVTTEPKRRGRKPKAENLTTSQPVTTEPKRRGRKPKAERNQ